MYKTLRLFILIIIIAFLAIMGYNYIYQPHRDIQSEKVAYDVKASKIANYFEENQEEASRQYLNKTISISGTITAFTPTSITLDNKVYCMFSDSTLDVHKGEKTTVKGRCIGFDDLLIQVKLDQCSLITHQDP